MEFNLSASDRAADAAKGAKRHVLKQRKQSRSIWEVTREEWILI
jgi:hypothetical protein